MHAHAAATATRVALDEHQQARRRPRRRPAAGAGRSGHRQDHDPGRGDRPTGSRTGRRARPGARPDVLPQGRRAAPRPGHRPARPHHVAPSSARRSTPSPTAWCGRYAPAELYAAPLRLLSAPEQDVVLQELLTDNPESVRWPEELRAAVGTRGFAREVHAVLSRARERGLDPDDLVALGRDEEVPEFVAAGPFLEQYLDVLDDQSRHRLPRPDRPRGDRGRARTATSCGRGSRHVFVDEYQDTDPSQVALLRAIAGDGRDLIVVGDPDQSIYGFRGADVRGILDFPAAVPDAPTARPAPVVALGTTRRFGSRLLRASRSDRRLDRGSPARSRASTYAAFREPERRRQRVRARPGRGAHLRHRPRRDRAHRRPAPPGPPRGRHRLVRDGGAGALRARPRSRRCGAPWPPPASRSRWPATRPRWSASPPCCRCSARSRVVVDADIDDPHRRRLRRRRPGRGAADLAARRARRHRRPRRSTRAMRGARPGRRPARELVRRRRRRPDVARPAWTASRPAARPRLAAAARRAPAPSSPTAATAEEVLWTLWDGTDWGRRLRAATQSRRPAAPGSRTATSTPSARCSRPPPAPRSSAATPASASSSPPSRAQEIPADTLADRGVRGDAVRLLTAHRSKGLEWRLVVVAHVQEGAWPDLRRRGTLLQADRIGRDGLRPAARPGPRCSPRSAGCSTSPCTRARQRLVVTAVQSPDDDGEQPSRFVHELGREPDAPRRAGPRRPLSLAGLVAELRRTLADPDQPEPLRARRRPAAAAARRRPTSTAARSRRPPTRRPGGGCASRRRSERPVRPDDEPLTLSASALEGLLTCPAQWFLQREAGGEVVSSTSQGFGKVVHALAERIAKGDARPTTRRPDGAASTRSGGGWSSARPWSRAREREAVAGGAGAASSPGTSRPGARTVSPPSRGCGPR